VRQLSDGHQALQKELKKTKAEMFSGATRSVGEERRIGECVMVTFDFEETDRDTMAGWVDAWKSRAEPRLAVALGTVNGKRTFLSSASGSAVRDYGVDMGDLAKNVLPRFGGRGGGKPSFAQGSVAMDTVASQLFETIHSFVESQGLGKGD
jgi:alanyl-tRNA synthetase